jgi:hypothetical protein
MSPTCSCRKTAPPRRPADRSARCHRGAELATSSLARGIGAEGRGGWRVEFPSTFPPPDARPRGTGRYGRGRLVTAGDVGGLFVLVTTNGRVLVGTGGDPRGAAGATCKIAGIAYVSPMHLALTPNSVRTGGPARSTRTRRYGRNGVNYDGYSCNRPPLPLWRGAHGNFTAGDCINGARPHRAWRSSHRVLLTRPGSSGSVGPSVATRWKMARSAPRRRHARRAAHDQPRSGCRRW